jgi:hypothetical protein
LQKEKQGRLQNDDGGGEDDQRRPIRDTGAADTWEAHTVAADTGAVNIGTADTGASDTREAVSSSHPQKLKTVHDGKKLITASLYLRFIMYKFFCLYFEYQSRRKMVK